MNFFPDPFYYDDHDPIDAFGFTPEEVEPVMASIRHMFLSIFNRSWGRHAIRCAIQPLPVLDNVRSALTESLVDVPGAKLKVAPAWSEAMELPEGCVPVVHCTPHELVDMYPRETRQAGMSTASKVRNLVDRGTRRAGKSRIMEAWRVADEERGIEAEHTVTILGLDECGSLTDEQLKDLQAYMEIEES